MNSRDDLRRIPLIAIALLGGAIVCLSVSAIPTSFVSQLGAVQNEASTVALDRVFANRIVPALRIVSGVFLLLGAASLYWRRAVFAVIGRIGAAAERMDGLFLQETRSVSGLPPRALAYLAGFCAVMVLLQYWPSLLHGYFAYDDFEMLAVQQANSLISSLFLLHGDHTVPVLRLEMALLYALFGTDPIAGNILLLALFTVTILLGALLLREMSIGAIGIFVFISLTTSWMLWAEMLAGYYMISIYLQQLALSLLGAWAYLRWRRTGRRVFLVLVASAVVISPFLDLSGLWVPCAIMVFMFCAAIGQGSSFGSWWRHESWLLAAVILSLAGAALFNAYVFLVASPGRFLAMGGTDAGVWSAIVQLFYFVSGGLFATLLFPLGYWKLPPGVLLPFLALATLAVLGALALSWPKLSRPTRAYFVAIILIILGNGLVVVTGRPASGFTYPWQAKYAGAAYVWFCLGLGAATYMLWRRVPGHRKGLGTELVGIGVVLLVAVQVMSNFLVPLFTDAPYGYAAYLKAAQERRRAVAYVSGAFAPLLREDDVRLPLLTGTAIGNRFPALVHYDLNCYRPFLFPPESTVSFYGNAALSAGESARVVCAGARKQGYEVRQAASLRSAVSPSFVRELGQSVALQELYLSPIPMSGSPCAAGTNERTTSARRIDVVDGEQQSVPVGSGRWDPEGAGDLTITMQYLGPHPEALVHVLFRGDFSTMATGGWIVVPAGAPVCRTIDLLQLPSYALSKGVEGLTVQFATPGRYAIGSATLAD